MPEPAMTDQASEPLSGSCPRGIAALVLVAAILLPLLFAALTGRVWEDFYITYKHSKNLAQGQGMVFTPGQRVHGFTSPLGTLVPAGLCWLTGGHSDTQVLWLYRIFSACCLAGTAGILLSIVSHRKLGALGGSFLLGMFLIDSKTLNFATNGMETGLLVLFVALVIYELVTPAVPRTLVLGSAWAGLMWTRPDGFIYILALGGAFWVFSETRARLLHSFLRAGLVAALLYLPWFLGAWWYYGSPVPHTITAKSGLLSVPYVVAKLIDLPARFLPFVNGPSYPDSGFNDNVYFFLYAPAYIGSPLTSLHSLLVFLAGVVYFLARRADHAGRSLSLAFLLVALYLFVIPRCYPWYYPPCALLGIAAIAFALKDVDGSFAGKPGTLTHRRLLGLCVLIVIVSQALTTVAATYHSYVEQQEIEENTRKPIGLWLKDHGAPTDTVFVECLGYIGYFCEMKMYDYPGLVSPEVVQARRQSGDTYADVIRTLKPVWLVLRPWEAAIVEHDDAELLENDYQVAKVFDTRANLQQYPWLPWRDTMGDDNAFIVYRRREGARHEQASPQPQSSHP